MLALAPAPIVVNAEFPQKMQGLFRTTMSEDDSTHPRYKVFYGGRGGAKSWSGVRASLLIGMGGGPAGQLRLGDGRQHDGLRTLCIREIQDSLRDSIKKGIADQIQNLQLAEHYEVLDETIRGRRGTTAQGTEYIFEGLRRNLNKIKSYEGIDLVLGDEVEPITGASWDVLEPTIRAKPPNGPLKCGAEFWLFFNPVLETSETYQRFVIHPTNNTLVTYVNWRDNPWFALEQLKPNMERDRVRSLDLYNHIWEGHCLVNLEGAVYADEMREAQEQGRICELEYSRTVPVSVYFDIGHRDYTVMWFVQRSGWDYKVIDFYMNNRRHIDHYLEVLQRRGYIYDCLWLPHDAQSKTVGTKMSVEEQVKEKGYKGRCKIVPKLSLADGINAVRTVFPTCYFDRARCAEGIQGLREYLYEIDPVTKQLGKTPMHSDIADGFRYFAVASRMGEKIEFKLKLPEPDAGRIGLTSRLWGGFAGQKTSTGWMK